MKKRVISAIVALAIVVPLYIIGGIPLYLLAGMIGILGYKEILDLRKSHGRIPIGIKFLGVVSLLLVMFTNYDGYALAFGISYQAIAFLLLSLLLPTLFIKDESIYNTNDAFYMIGSVLLIGVVFNSFILLRNLNVYLLVYLFLVTALNDTFAYLLGSLIGKHKLIPRISPKKTIEGSVSGLILGTFVSVMFYHHFIGGVSIPVLIITTLVLSVLGQLGDLLFSKIKRENDIKDFSNIMPGHGGILDRLDSLSIVILAFVLLIKYL